MSWPLPLLLEERKEEARLERESEGRGGCEWEVEASGRTSPASESYESEEEAEKTRWEALWGGWDWGW